ncbi:ABC transporter permease [Pontibacter sp. BT310]|uniref:ABC transporter permease n=1 Tax=Pontibacter populi TaxID=890055 RepID=A0ABS6XFS9_9BACT|nr:MULTISPECIES: M1 family aminopeptidase [Pontibacter]MBJ6119525.1 ABC transporter permease [Pontibacter sp. BT310]MBR0571952.1 ABC transporter permease [Microvirga sp. STS03]MBW3366378.1 ABC transporter permease [Pontibacter populi]
MFKEIFLFELKYRMKRPATYIYFFILFLMAFLTMLALGGAFGGGVIIGDASGGKVFANSPYQINWIVTLLSWFGVLITCSMMGTPIFRDFEHKTHSLYYTTPISKAGYIFGRFTGSFLVTLFVFTGVALGAMVATFMPWMEPDKVGPFNLMWYIQPYLTIIIPNLLLTGSIFFTLATLTRSALSIYVGGVIFLVMYGIASSLTSDLDNEFIANLTDPLGASAIYLTQRYWTTAERNTLMLPFSEYVLLNRGLWLTIGLGLLAFCYYKFSFSFANTGIKLFRRKNSAEAVGVIVPSERLNLPKVSQSFSFNLSLKQYFKLSKLEFNGVIKSVYFIAIVTAGIIFLFVSGAQVGKMYDTNTFPVTSQVVTVLNGTFALFFLIIITFYSGELVWRERDNHINQIYDALPIPNWVPFASKMTALMLVQVVLLFVIMICGIIIQTFKGYYKYEIDVYLQGLFGINLIDYLLLCVLAMLVQVIVNNKFIGHFVMVVYYLLNIFKGQLGFEHTLYSYSSDPGITYSAMNGYGHFVWPFTIYKIYWAAFALLLAIVANMLWSRGSENMLKWRLKLASMQLTRSTLFVTAAGLIVFLITGGFIFYNTNILNKYRTSDDQEERQAYYEKTYKKYDGIPQPRITDVNLNVDIYPEERIFDFKGYFWIKNTHNQPIDSVHVAVSDEAEVRKLEFDRPAKLALNDKDYGYRIYKLAKPMQPGDSMRLNLDLHYATKGFRNNGSNTGIVYNGTFINSEYLPKIGYRSGVELSDDDLRKEHGLKPKPRMADVNDSVARMNTYISNEADWINFETTVSTIPSQIAIAPGYLQKEWTKDGRRYFHYKMDAPILNFYSFLSADYQVKKDHWKGKNGQNVAIEIYYHKGHEYNLDRMIKSVKKSLDYFTENFSPYQHKQVRILEFPGYQSFAQSFPNTIPYSESIGFIADVDDDDPEDVDYPFYVTAHEIAHQWWAHQVIGGDVQGSVLMSETMSQYSALMVMKHEYGEERMNKFLKYELNSYLLGRTSERKKEMPLYKVENQGYIHYRKGSVIMYALADYIGEENLNKALQKYIQKVAFQRAPYTNSVEFLGYIREATPDSLQYMVTDMFEKITLYENKTTDASYKKLADNKYKVTFTVDAKKLYADSLGTETPAKMNDWVDVGVIARHKVDGNWQDKPLYLKKHKIKAGENKFEFIVNEKPEKAGIDPMNKLIDRNPTDNTKKVTEG